jgi:predicted ATPase
MYIRTLKLRNVKLFRDLTVDFLRAGKPRMWTVVLGENGTCKTTLLQALAMAASGPTIAGRVAASGRGDILRALRTRGAAGESRMNAEFGFGVGGHHGYPDQEKRPYPRNYPDYPGTKRPPEPPTLHSQLYQMAGSDEISGISWYHGKKPKNISGGPLARVRAQDEIEPFWFVAAYGVDRNLPQASGVIERHGVQERVQSLFGNHSLSATRWSDHFSLTENHPLAEAYRATLSKTLLTTQELIPGLTHLDLAIKDVQSQRNPVERQRARERVADREQELPIAWMSQGFQSSLAWIADLVGQILQEAQAPVDPGHMEGLVLIDEIDLHLHPLWQVGIVQALKTVFPRLQFVATTHSPLVITGCDADEVIRLDRANGEVVQVTTPAPEQRTLTGTELYWNYFELSRLIPNPVGQDIHDYGRLARNGARTPAEQKELERLTARLDHLNERPAGTVLPLPHRAAR